MKLDINDEGHGILEGDEDELSHIYSEGIAYMLIKGMYNLEDKDVIAACKSYAELHLKVDPVPVEDVGDEWAYWTPGDIK